MRAASPWLSSPALPRDECAIAQIAPQRIAVFRALQLGDMLCAVPALRALRAACPQAAITLIGLPWARAFVARFADLIDDFMHFPGAVGFPEQEETDADLPSFIAQARRMRFDLAIQLHGSGGIANDIVFKLGARHNAGFVQPGEIARSGWFMRWPDGMRESERYTALMRLMGVSVPDEGLSFPLTAVDRAEAATRLRDIGVDPRKAVVVHAGAQLPSRRWPAERFAQVADALARDGLRILLTGTAGEIALAEKVRAAMSRPAISLAGSTTLGGLAALVARVRLVVCNDTGISHIAAAVRTPSVVIASGSDTRRWAPRDKLLHCVLADFPACRPCSYAMCPFDHSCALNVSVTDVIAAAHRQLRLAIASPAKVSHHYASFARSAVHAS